MGPRDRASICLRTPAAVKIGLIKPIQHKSTTRKEGKY
jgi:hypothetical protein